MDLSRNIAACLYRHKNGLHCDSMHVQFSRIIFDDSNMRIALFWRLTGDFGALRNEFTAKKLFELHTNDLHCHVLRNANLSQNLSI